MTYADLLPWVLLVMLPLFISNKESWKDIAPADVGAAFLMSNIVVGAALLFSFLLRKV